MKRWWIRKIAKGLVFLTLALVIFGWGVMMLWNGIVPDVFNGPELSFWQAVGLLVLSHVLLRGWTPWLHRSGWGHDRWKRRFEEKLAAMAPEEREKFKEEWKRRCGSYPGEWEEKKEQAKPS
ncbi:MAG TPA: hypothetical protein VGB10_06410 [Bacteroidota bacterium]